MIMRPALFTAVLLAALPAQAQDLFPLPRGCTAYVTAQIRNCQVAHSYRCAGDAAGDQWVTYLDGEGPYFSSKIDSETRWLESVDLYTGEADTIQTEADPASFTVLLQSGRDDFDFTTVANTGEVTRFKGFDALTGEKVTVDGVVLERTRFRLEAFAEDGTFLWRREGNQLIQRDWRIFYSDAEDFENAAGDKVSTLDTPVEFAFPGDKGFLATEPKYDCDVVTASVEGQP